MRTSMIGHAPTATLFPYTTLFRSHTAWHWMLDRGGVLRQFRFEWPVLDGALLLTLLHWLMFLVILGGILWNINQRSEEHTSELQSRFDLVCRLLLEKKNDINHWSR